MSEVRKQKSKMTKCPNCGHVQHADFSTCEECAEPKLPTMNVYPIGVQTHNVRLKKFTRHTQKGRHARHDVRNRVCPRADLLHLYDLTG